MKNKIQDLRNHLFETIELLKDKDQPMDIDRARTISAVAQTIINSAKVEADFLREVGGLPTAFLQGEPSQSALTDEDRPALRVVRNWWAPTSIAITPR